MCVDVNDIDYELPERLIAQTPCEPRDAARLLVNAPSGMIHRHVSDIDSLFHEGDVMVVNHTKGVARTAQVAPSNGWSSRGVAT